MTAKAVDELVDVLNAARDPLYTCTGATRTCMHAARPDTAHLPARWWRHVVARACQEVPGVVITS
ncbi:hypothetical protein [Mycobacterium botniense]|uniref:hypothetical protein n=1 Tax=Mycobacterium botniense TaxID=84962 RepID=UPI0013D00A72|nr:hypothetical protein [Mycobacterium botniense]